MQSKNACTLDEGSYSGDGKKWSDSKCILKSESTVFADKSQVECRREESWVTSRFLFLFFIGAIGRMKLPFTEICKNEGGADLKEKKSRSSAYETSEIREENRIREVELAFNSIEMVFKTM